jgi:uncharacterized protein (TIGR00730 family)
MEKIDMTLSIVYSVQVCKHVAKPVHKNFRRMSYNYTMLHTKTHVQEENKSLKHDIHEGRIEKHLDHITHELRSGFNFIHRFPKSVSIFGSSLTPFDAPDYKKATELAERIVRELGYTILTGGGPGIMEAANKGAYNARKNGHSAGLSISLPHENSTNLYASEAMKFSYFFTRKALLTFAAETFIFFPGGYGTFDELFSILTLVQTGKIPRVPIILVDSQFWNPLDSFLRTTMLGKYKNIDTKDLELYEIVDSFDLIIERIRRAPVSEFWRNLN